MPRPRPPNRQLLFSFAKKPAKARSTRPNAAIVESGQKTGRNKKNQARASIAKSDAAYWKKHYSSYDEAALEDARTALTARFNATYPSQTKQKLELILRRSVVDEFLKQFRKNRF